MWNFYHILFVCAGYREMIYSCVIEQGVFSHKSNLKLKSVKVASN
jgi:hypothetical protein